METLTDTVAVAAPSTSTMTGREKAAAVLLSLDTETAAQVMADFDEDEIMQLTGQMCNMRSIDGERINSVIEECMGLLDSAGPVGGSIEAVGELLEQVMGSKGRTMLSQMLQQRNYEQQAEQGLRALRDLGTQELLSLVQSEHPQMISLIMSHLEPDRAASLLAQLAEELQTEVITRMARSENTSREIIARINTVLESRAQSFGSVQRDTPEERYKTVAEILNMVGRSTERTVLDGMAREHPEMAEEIKNLMFVFEDVVAIDDRSLQKILSQVDTKTLAMALKTASDPIKEKILGNLSKRAGQTIAEELELLGPRPLSEVEEAQKGILDVIKRMQDDGEITISRGKTSGEQLV